MNWLLRRHAPLTKVCFGGVRSFSAAELSGHVEELASRLPVAERGRAVVIACDDRYAFSVALLASWKRAFVAVLPPNALPDTERALVERTNAVAVLHDRDGAGGVDVRDVLKMRLVGTVPLRLPLAGSEPAVIAFTSGSTGEPEPYPKALAQLLDEATTLVEHFGLVDAQVVSCVSPCHLYGLLFGVVIPLIAGGAMSRMSPLLPQEVARLLRDHQADVLVAVPPHLQAASEESACVWPVLRRVFCSGAPLPDEVASALAARGMPVTQVLGSTETGGIASREHPGEPWRTLPEVRVGASEQGRLWVDARWLAADQARPFQTQDRVELVSGGFVHRGRLDQVVKVGGRRVNLGDIEARLRSLPCVRDARVLARANGSTRGTEVLAVVEGEGLDARQLKRGLLGHIHAAALPRRFRFVRALPRTAAGKVSTQELLSLFCEGASHGSANDRP